jgi:hypothetical protein
MALALTLTQIKVKAKAHNAYIPSLRPKGRS